MRYHLLALPAPSEGLPLALPAPSEGLPLAPPAPSGGLPLAPPAPSGGAWGDASPQTPAKKSVRRIMGRVLVSAVAVVDATDLTARRSAWTGRGQMRRMDGSRDRGPSPISRFPDSRAVRLAGVWGEASPQAPPEARWTAGRSRGASQPWAGGARRDAQAGGAKRDAQAEGARRDAQAEGAKRDAQAEGAKRDAQAEGAKRDAQAGSAGEAFWDTSRWR